MNHKLAILLATYNSERYLAAQLDSLLAQSYSGWELFVHDDQSVDATQSILCDYAARDSRIHILADDRPRGAKHAFMWLLQQVESDFYMFCDHDDVWLPEKIARSMQTMMQQAIGTLADVPLLVCTDAKLVDANLNVLAESYWENRCHRPWMFNDRYFHLFYNNIIGCTMLFNRKAREVALPYPADTAMHDSWLVAAVLWRGGRVFPVNEPLMLYRQHGDNTIGAPKNPSLWHQLCDFGRLSGKTSVQHRASQPLVKISLANFFVLKIKYLLQEHWRMFYQKIKR